LRESKAFELACWRFASPLVPRGGSGMWAEEALKKNPEYYVTSVWVGVGVAGGPLFTWRSTAL